MEKLKVMIVEDELITAEAIAVLLRRINYNPTVIVTSGEEALSKIKEMDLDLILMDIILAGNLDGIETAKIIHRKYNIPIIFITAYGDKKTLDRAKLAEPYGYIVKPITSESEIQPAIELAIYNHQVKNKLKRDHKKFQKIRQLIQPNKNISTPQATDRLLTDSTNFKRAQTNKDLKRAQTNKDLKSVKSNKDPMSEIEILGKKVTLIDWLKCISNAERFLILEALKSQSLTIKEIEILIQKSQSTASHHIKKLEKTGLVKGWKKGKYIYYTLNKPKLLEFVNLWESWIKKLSSYKEQLPTRNRKKSTTKLIKKKIKDIKKRFKENISYKVLRENMEIIANEDRFLILNLINNEPCLISDLEKELDKTRASISHHVRILEKNNFIQSSKKGKFKKYTISREKFMKIQTLWNHWFHLIRLNDY
ncbi:MAG: metalloregulator ArsR/SmtB family transcription factor [Promethearchaeia archaeon]